MKNGWENFCFWCAGEPTVRGWILLGVVIASTMALSYGAYWVFFNG